MESNRAGSDRQTTDKGCTVSVNAEAPVCPGCHFGCLVSGYRCGRGKAFHDLWVDGKPVPERRKPPIMRSGGAEKAPQGGPMPSSDMRIMHGLNIMANILQDRHTESAERKVLMAAGRQGGFFACDMLAKRTLVDDERVLEAVSFLVERGFAERVLEEVAGEVLRITPTGKEQLAEWDAERDAATADFLSPLDGDEKAQLADMLFRIIQAELEKNRGGSC